MSVRSSAVRLLIHTGMVVGAIFAVTVLLAAMRPQTASDVARANEIVAELRTGIEKYRDYHVALNEGYKIFLLNLPQQEYHFTKYQNGFLEAFRFDPSQPTSLLYRKTADGYE